ncbi:MAG: T9SS type A sorting domain-containing protein [Flavobacterium sp.]|uniref:reprolysin-like metallopeptidase n=1 Tax=Flavobacterium sp. TaxID=239 RepID=UPI0012091D52|nr:zinc-dependent metalloprotease family protein [Flavobacterium sp.]RZJ66866.1 MAG: T9SS type A sorting domain-containing protein [Flavobacterium sp.]
MKYRLLSIALLAMTGFSFAQQGRQAWKPTIQDPDLQIVGNKTSLTNPRLFELNTDQLKQAVSQAPKRFSGSNGVIVSLPNPDGNFERFRVTEFSNMDPELAARYPEIKSYTGKSLDHAGATVYFSISPLGLQSMTINPDKSAVFIEPYTTDQSVYTVYRKSDKVATLTQWDCNVIAEATKDLDASMLRPNADDGNLRNYRLAMSVTGEYTAYFGGTKALALAAINNSMTRVNGVFETDLGIHMNLISNTDAVIYTSASTDPYSNASTGAGGAWNQELQTTLTNTIGSANYDIGHLFGATGGGGNAGCIGCVCKNPTTSVPLGKGSGYTSPADGIPSGDNFDIDYVAHEIGHQFGGNHTFSMSNEGTIAQCEPGSGSTIMGYAGITGSTDVQAHSDAYFHAVSIQQITNYVKTTTCQTTTVTGNAIPTANAGADYTVPKGTPFILNGSGSDANGGALTYCWEQMNQRTTTNSMPTATKTGGPNFRSYSPTTSTSRMFPRLETVKTGATAWTWEAVPTVARTLNFRFTVRDNQGSLAANNSDDMVVTVNATAGPFAVSVPNTAVSYVGGSSQTVTWAVAGTTANGVNCANVDILLSTDGGNTFPITLLAATPNDGTQAVTIPNTPGTQNRIMVKGTNHIFFDMSNANFTITGGTSDTTAPSTPTLSASATTQSTTNLSWTTSTDNVAVTGYDVYRNGAFLASSTTTSLAVTGLTASTTYTFYVKAKDAAGNQSANSNTVSVTTLAPTTDTTAPSAPTLSASGTTQTTTNLSWTASTDNVGVTGYDVYRNGAFLASSTTTSYSVTGLTAATTYTFYVFAKDAAGNQSVNSNTVSVTTLSSSVTYCTSQGNSVADEKIGKVVFGTINNTSTGGTGYTNFTALSTNVTKGSAYTITITPQWTSTIYNEGYAVFIDYNQDGDFADSGETVWTKTASKTTPVSGSITIPASALNGATRMRVSMKYNGVPTSCETFSYGQVEDYTVNIVSSGRMDESQPQISYTVYPNPVQGSELFISNVDDNATFRIVNTLGQQVGKGKISNGSVQVDTLKAGTYLLEITSGEQTQVKRFIKQ